MSVTSPSAAYAERPGSADLPGGAPRTLADEHVLLLGQVAARARELLAVVSRGGWPGAELAALAGYAQAEVLRHASDEETLLFPAGRSEAAIDGAERTSETALPTISEGFRRRYRPSGR